jgi:hypothetical protein
VGRFTLKSWQAPASDGSRSYRSFYKKGGPISIEAILRKEAAYQVRLLTIFSGAAPAAEISACRAGKLKLKHYRIFASAIWSARHH